MTAFVFCLQISGLSQKAKVGVSGGVALANMNATIDGEKQNWDGKSGYTAGMIMDVPFAPHFSFRPGVHYVQKGTVQQETTGNTTEKIFIALRYAELTFNFLFNTNTTGAKGNFFVGAGPAVSLNLPSKTVTKTGGVKTEGKINFGNTIAEDLKGVDYGVNFLIGCKITGGMILSANYTHGLRNLVPDGYMTDDKLKNTCLSFQLGVLFNNNSK